MGSAPGSTVDDPCAGGPAGDRNQHGVADHWRLYRRLVVAQVRSEWQYRTSFLLFALAQALVTALELLAVLILLELVSDLGGWTAAEVLLLYGLATVPFTATDVIVSPVEDVADYVREGTFDRLLLRPMSALVQLCGLEFELRRAGKMLPTVASLAYGLVAVDIDWSPTEWVMVAVALVNGAVIYTALWVATASFSFWAVAGNEAGNALTYGGNFANQYPLHLYPTWVRAVLGWAIPLAFVAYVPAVTLLDAPNPLGVPPWLFAASPVVSLVTLGVALQLWRVGIRHYQGTGS